MAKSIRIRMYRPGFGDCFLLSFGSAAAARHVLVDFGAHQKGEIGTMEPIMDDIERVTSKRLHLVVASHQHRDHISGFGKFADRFAQFTIGEVWMPWTDDPDDPEALKLQKKQLALYDRLALYLQAKPAADDKVHIAALAALDNLRGNGPARVALQHGFNTGADVRYFKGGTFGVTVSGIPEFAVDILAPSKDKTALTRMDPPTDQHFLTVPGLPDDRVRPFPRFEIGETDPYLTEIIDGGQPSLLGPELGNLKSVCESSPERLALALDNVRNNTSLVTLFRYKGKTLLFPGDAQWGNWQSWIGTDRGKELLRQIDFLKVAHHGSENATPVAVEQALRDSGLAVMVPTQVEPFPTIPRLPLITALERHCAGHVAVRSDWVDIADAPKGPAPRPRLPAGFKKGTVWIDYSL